MPGTLRDVSLVGLLIMTVLAGCLGNVPDDGPELEAERAIDLSHLGAEGAEGSWDGTSLTFVWDGAVGPGAAAPLVGGLPGAETALHTFQVDGDVGYVIARGTSGSGTPLLFALLDEQDRIVCAFVSSDDAGECIGPVATNQSLTDHKVRVQQYGEVPGGETPEAPVPYELTVVLRPTPLLRLTDIADLLDHNMTFRLSDTGHDGGEPTLGLTSDGAIFVIEGTATLRSTDDGATWVDVTPPGTTTTLDPMMTVDPWNDRVYVNHLYVACSYMSWSDDQGETWITNPAACGDTAIDHQKITVGGAFGPGIPYDGTVYFSFNSFALMVPGAGHLVVSRSLDGGVTWTPAVAVTEQFDYEYRTGGPIAADRDGNVYIPMYLSDGAFGVAVSNDHGVTWNAVRAGDHSAGGEGIDPGLAIDTAGNAYGAYWGEGAVRVTSSTDRGASWSEPVVVSPPQLASFVLADATAGDAGRVAVAYLASADTVRGPNNAAGFARWHLYVSYTEDALAETPTWHTTRVNDYDDPVQIGSICTGGIGCFGGNRNLLDFIDIQPGPDGRLYVAYTDGCQGDCELPQESRARRGMVAVQEEGPRMFVSGAPWG